MGAHDRRHVTIDGLHHVAIGVEKFVVAIIANLVVDRGGCAVRPAFDTTSVQVYRRAPVSASKTVIVRHRSLAQWNARSILVPLPIDLSVLPIAHTATSAQVFHRNRRNGLQSQRVHVRGLSYTVSAIWSGTLRA